jgi:hypothetical protein
MMLGMLLVGEERKEDGIERWASQEQQLHIFLQGDKCSSLKNGHQHRWRETLLHQLMPGLVVGCVLLFLSRL